jgi:hypothetical protein
MPRKKPVHSMLLVYCIQIGDGELSTGSGDEDSVLTANARSTYKLLEGREIHIYTSIVTQKT